MDANLHHDLASGKTITTILHLVNGIPINWYAKKQATVESAMYGSEFVAARAAVDQIIGLRAAHMYLDVPIRSKSFMFGDNKSVVTSSMILTSSFSNKHCISSYHHVREAIAAKLIGFYRKDGKANHILSKHWKFASIWPLLKPLLLWRGDTKDANRQQTGSDTIPTNHPSSDPGDGGSNSSLAGS